MDLPLLEWPTLDRGFSVGLGHLLHIIRPWFMRQAHLTQVVSWIKDSSRPIGILMGTPGFYELTRVRTGFYELTRVRNCREFEFYVYLLILSGDTLDTSVQESNKKKFKVLANSNFMGYAIVFYVS